MLPSQPFRPVEALVNHIPLPHRRALVVRPIFSLARGSQSPPPWLVMAVSRAPPETLRQQLLPAAPRQRSYTLRPCTCPAAAVVPLSRSVTPPRVVPSRCTLHFRCVLRCCKEFLDCKLFCGCVLLCGRSCVLLRQNVPLPGPLVRFQSLLRLQLFLGLQPLLSPQLLLGL